MMHKSFILQYGGVCFIQYDRAQTNTFIGSNNDLDVSQPTDLYLAHKTIVYKNTCFVRHTTVEVMSFQSSEIARRVDRL